MLGIGGNEIAIILVFAFLLFGPDKLPQMGKTIGRALRQFRETQEKLTNVVQTEVVDPMTAAAQAPLKKAVAGDEDAKPAVDTDEDADIATEGAAPARKETFAERRARLAAERAAREQAEAASADAAEGAGVDAAAVESTSPDATSSATEPESEPTASAPEDSAATDEVRATEDLYARRPRRTRAQAPATDDEAPKGGER